MKLQILIPQYNEDEAVIKPLLDSIALQQNVDFDEIGVIIVNDGSDVILSGEFLSSYPYEIEYHVHEHAGVSAARNACLNYAKADYVMFCDADDMFFNACGLYIVFNEIAKSGFDTLVSVFNEESRHPETKEVVYVNHEMDSTFVHGKIHKRKYLLDNNIRWNDKLTIHEDSYFNILAQQLAPKAIYCPVPFYLWRWRDESVCRHDPKYILKTYKNMIESNDALIDEFLKRGREDKAMLYTAVLVFDAYYSMNKPEWINQDNVGYRRETELKFADYYARRKALWDKVPQADKMQISAAERNRSISEGMQMEAVTIDDWLKHISKMTKTTKIKGDKKWSRKQK